MDVDEQDDGAAEGQPESGSTSLSSASQAAAQRVAEQAMGAAAQVLEKAAQQHVAHQQ